MQSEAPENKVTATVKIDRRELLATLDWLEKVTAWFRQGVERTREQIEKRDQTLAEEVAEHYGQESILFKTADLDGFITGLEETVDTLQALKPDSS